MNTAESASRAADALLAEGLIAGTDRDRARATVLAALGPAAASRAGLPKLVEVVAYLGATLVLAAGCLFLAQTWNDLGDAGRIGALALIAVVLGVAGAVARPREDNEARRRLTGTLLAGAAVAAGFATALATEAGATTDYPWDGIYWPASVGGVTTAILGLVAYRLMPTAVGQLGILGGAVVAVSTLSNAYGGDEGLWVGVSLLALGALWLLLTETGIIGEETIARTLGVSLALFGAQFVALAGEDSWIGYVLTVGVAAVAIALYLGKLDWPYLAAAVIAITVVVPEAVSDWTDGSLGVIGGVLVSGITLLAASFAGFRLRAETTD